MAERRALVIGATGYVGHAVVTELVAHGIPVVAHVRFDSPQLTTWRARFARLGAVATSVRWDLEALARVLRDHAITHVFLCLGTNMRRRLRRSTSSIPDRYEQVDLGLSSLVLRACLASGRRPHVVLVSAVGARSCSWSPYWSAKGKLEDAVRASGLDFTIKRAAFITGKRPELRVFEHLGAVVVDTLLLVLLLVGLHRLRARYRSTNAERLASALVAAACANHASANPAMMSAM